MPEATKPAKPAKPRGLRLAADKALQALTPKKTYEYPVGPPKLPPGVVPEGVTAPVMALDSNPYQFAASSFPGGGFPGFAYLSNLATRAEFRAFAAAYSTEITREWLEFTSREDDGDSNSEKIKEIEAEFKRLNVRGAIQKAAEHDCMFGRGQLFIGIKGHDRKTPLILDPRTVKLGSLEQVTPIEAVWTTPAGYNALDPAAPDFYKPSAWFMLGQQVHASRLLNIVTRELPDILKPAFNFAGMSLSQLAEPYVDNWLRTRQSVADLINNFSITALATSMDQVLSGDDDGSALFQRATLFTATRSNKGLMLLDKDREELVQTNTPLSGLHELQAQSQEHMCSVSRMPATVLTGIQPSGLNASGEGEISAWYDWVAAQQEAYFREPLEIILKVVQLSLFGEIDADIGISFKPLYQMTPKELAEIREANSRTAGAYIDRGVLDPSEERERLARDPDSGYQGLDADALPVPPDAGQEPPEGAAMDSGEWEENKHPRGEGGQFGSGGGGGAPAPSKSAPKLKAGNVQVATPVGFTKDPDFGTYVLDHPNFPPGSMVDGKAITIKNGKVVGMHPSLAKQLGLDIVGERAGPTATQIAKEAAAEHAKAKATRDAKFTVGTMLIAEQAKTGKLTQEQAQAKFAELKAEYDAGEKA